MERNILLTPLASPSKGSRWGHLATLVGMTNNQPMFEGAEGITSTSSTVHAVVDIDGVVNFLAPRSLNLPGYPEWLGGSFTEKPAIWKEASPAYWVVNSRFPVCLLSVRNPSIQRYVRHD